ncbi:MAG TPA: hydroxymethylbilane synthase [Nevskiaceae bacterium]|nr:hydroxymethylbilane synthase [Nevskiaceae bacterium]
MTRPTPQALRIATRESPLALWQASHVKGLLERAHAGLVVELVPMTTSGDRFLDATLQQAGGKGLFVKELEQAMAERRADIAVHSMKDVPVHLPQGFALAAFLEAADPRDAFVCARFDSVDALPHGARVGTASLRRQAQLRARRPDLQISELRGNVGTRLRKLDEGQFDAILLACAGLDRLGFGERIRARFEVDQFVPAIGQGVIGIECRDDDASTRSLLAPLHAIGVATRLAAERAMNARLGGACHVPVAGHARVHGDELHLVGLVGAPDGTKIIRDEIRGAAKSAEAIGLDLAERLLARGAGEILRELGVKT